FYPLLTNMLHHLSTSLHLFGYLVIAIMSHAQSIFKTDLKEDVGPNSWRIIKKSYDQALVEKSDYFLIEMNTFGGAVNFADSIRTLLLNSPIKTVVYINNNAASAGTLISLASDHIFMQSGSSLGAS